MYHGNIRLGDTIHVKFTTVNTSGVPTTLSGTPVVSAYPGNSVTQLTAGITLTVDFDGVTGLNDVTIVASSGNGYATATNYALVITTGTVGGSSVVGYVIGSFSIENRAALMPTTAARTLDVSATGEAGVDWANVGGQATAVNLSSTTTNVVNTATAVTTVNGLAANVITAAAIAADAIGASELAADAVTEIRSLASGTSDSGTTTTMVDAARTEADTDYWVGALIVFTSGNIAGQARYITAFNAATDTITFAPATTQAVSTQTYEIWPTADFLRPTVSGRTLDVATTGEAGVDFSNINGTLDAAEIGAGAITAAKFAAGAIDAAALAADAGTEIAAAVWDMDATAHQTQGTFGQAIGDPAADTNTIYKAVVTDATGATVGVDVVAVQADTDDIQTRLPAALVGGRMDSSVGAMAANVVTAAATAADFLAEVNAEVVDALATDTVTLPGQSAPPLAPTIREMISWLYKNFRNRKSQTATQWSLFADDETTVDSKATVSDDGTTAVKQEIVSGP